MMYKNVPYWVQGVLLKVDEIKNMSDYKILYYFLFYILIFVLGSILILRFSRLLSYLFFSNDYRTEHFGEFEPLIKIKNKKLAWIVSFLVPIPIVVGLYFIRFANIGGFFWYLSLYTRPKTAFYTLGSIYFVEALLFLVITLEQKSARKICKSKRKLIFATLFYAILIISLFIVLIKYMLNF